jgi:hypothetical protein
MRRSPNPKCSRGCAESCVRPATRRHEVRLPGFCLGIGGDAKLIKDDLETPPDHSKRALLRY